MEHVDSEGKDNYGLIVVDNNTGVQNYLQTDYETILNEILTYKEK